MSTGFADLQLSDDVLRAIDALGFEEPTPIQAETIPILLGGSDVLAQAQTGTGKTAAFSLPIVQRVDVAERGVQALVLAPTRELAVQVATAMHELGSTKGLAVLPIYGGQAYDRQLRGLRSGVHVVVGTPGRVVDHIRRGTLDLSSIRMIVLDEADEMLDMGFVEDIEFILDQVPAERQIALFSATVPRRIEALARHYLRDPRRVTVAHEAVTAPQVHQMYVATQQRDKVEALTRILDLESPSSAIVFCRTKREVDELAGTLQSRGYTAAGIHGDINQGQRERLLQAFREGHVELLIATEVAARGLDIPDVTHVFNYDIPDDADAYIHRIGRTGRMGRRGDAITFVTPREVRQLRFIERQIQQNLEPIRIPTAADVAARRQETLRASLIEVVEAGVAHSYGELVADLAASYDLQQVAAAALYLAAGGSDAVAPPTTGPADVDGDNEPAAKPRRAPGGEPAGESVLEANDDQDRPIRLHFDAGRRGGVRAKDIVGLLTAETGLAGSAIGAIDIAADFTIVEMQASAARVVLGWGAPLVLRGREVRITRARDDLPTPVRTRGGRKSR